MVGFFNRVYRLVSLIPAGQVATYGQIAALLGQPKSAKIVGWAMRSAPVTLNLPCHRVISKSGRLAPEYAFGGKENQRFLLESEGITFQADGSVNMANHFWEISIEENSPGKIGPNDNRGDEFGSKNTGQV